MPVVVIFSIKMLTNSALAEASREGREAAQERQPTPASSRGRREAKLNIDQQL